jgi:O-antigen/teichoic acid export membrane protein
LENRLLRASLKLRKQGRRFVSSDLKHVLKGSSWMAASGAIVAGLYLVELALLARYLTPDLLGIYFLILSIPELVQGVLKTQFGDIIIRYLMFFIKKNEPQRAIALIKLNWLVNAGTGVMVFFIVALISNFASNKIIGDTKYAPLMLIYAGGIAFGSIDVTSGPVLRAFQRYDILFLLSSCTSFIRLAIIGAIIWYQGNLQSLVIARTLALIVTTIVMGVISILFLKQSLGSHFKAKIGELRGYWREIIGFGVNTNIAATIKTLSSKFDAIIVGLVLGTASVSIYKVATQLSRTLLLLSDPVDNALYPHFTSIVADGDTNRLDALAKRITIFNIIIAMPIISLAFIFRKELTMLFAGPAYKESAIIFFIAACGVVFWMIFFWTSSYLLSLGLAYQRTVSVALGRLVGLALLFILTIPYGIMGAAVGFGMMYISVVAINLCQIYLWKNKQAKDV